MMGSMPNRDPLDRTDGNRQLDLFTERGRKGRGESPRPAAAETGLAVAALADDELTAMIARAELWNVEALCSEAATRSLQSAVPALESLWRRFAGFGMGVPLLEQVAVLRSLGALKGAAARTALKRIVLSDGLSESLLPDALQAAADAGLALPGAFVGPLLGHDGAAIRAPAYELAVRAELRGDLLLQGLSDRCACIRRRLAVAMGNRGDREARGALLQELAANPSPAVIEAIATIMDEDVIVHLGRCADRHPALRRMVIDMLRDLDSPRARRLVRRLEGKTWN